MKPRAIIGLASLALLGAVPAAAQGVRIDAPTPSVQPEARVVPPGLHYEQTRPPDADAHRETPKVEHDPAFIEPLAKAYRTPTGRTGRLGLSGWTAPTPPVGPRQTYQDHNGYFALGFSVTWDGPPVTAAAPQQRPPR